MRNLILILACLPALLAAGCATQKISPLSQRGWIGGEYVLAKPSTWWNQNSGEGVACTLPKSLQTNHPAAIQITRINTNAPAEIAGLHSGDFIVELKHQPVVSLAAFRQMIDRSQPGSWLPVKAWRNGQFLDYNVQVGREKYKASGYFAIILPTVVERWDLWPDPGFSLVCIGYEPNPGLRHELPTTPGPHKLYNEDYQVYLVILKLSLGERVVSQAATHGLALDR